MIKKLVLPVIFAGLSWSSVSGQIRYGDGPPPKFFVEADFRSGGYSEKINTGSTLSGYSNPINPYAGDIQFTGTKSYTYNLHFGYYFNRNRNIAVVSGLFYQRETGSMQLDSFHVEYMALDYQGNVFRQLISTAGPTIETVKSSNISIPLLLRYKKDIRYDMFLTFDGGVLFNLLMQNKYNSTAGFDYEAIYKIEGSGTNLTYQYDNSPTPGGTDWLITKTEFLKDNPKGNMQAYFNSLQSVGYSVGLGDSTKKSGKINYKARSVGATLQAALNYKIRDKISGKAGLYLQEQSFTNGSASNSTTLTHGPGEYNPLINFTKSVQNWGYGLMFGVNFFL